MTVQLTGYLFIAIFTCFIGFVIVMWVNGTIAAMPEFRHRPQNMVERDKHQLAALAKRLESVDEDAALLLEEVEWRKRNECSGIEKAVCDDIKRRQRLGVEKYGTTVAENPLPLRDWLQHAYEECLDQAIYLRRAIQEVDAKPANQDAVAALRDVREVIDGIICAARNENELEWQRGFKKLAVHYVDIVLEKYGQKRNTPIDCGEAT